MEISLALLYKVVFFYGIASTTGVSICTTTTTGNISIGTALNALGSLTIGTSASPCSINSTTTFLNLPLCSATPNSNNQLVNKKYVDDNFVDRTNNLSQDINGVKTFSSFPLCSATPNSNNQLVNKIYVDNNFVDKTTLQNNIGGNKTF